MSAPPISVQLSKFEQIEILRSEIDAREEEMKGIERRIREVLYEMERQRYLQTLHTVFHKLTPPEDAANLPQLSLDRDALAEAISVMKGTLTLLERDTAGQTAPPSRMPSRTGGLSGHAAPAAPAPGAPAPRRKFDF